MWGTFSHMMEILMQHCNNLANWKAHEQENQTQPDWHEVFFLPPNDELDMMWRTLLGN